MKEAARLLACWKQALPRQRKATPTLVRKRAGQARPLQRSDEVHQGAQRDARWAFG